jgi:hypothetical protein
MKLSNIFESLLNEASGGKYHVRFNLSNAKDKLTGKPIKMTWQIKTNNSDIPLDRSVLDFNPDELIKSDEFKSVEYGGVYNNFDKASFHLEISDCTLVNDSLPTAYQIKCKTNKTVVAGVDAGDVKVYFGSGSAKGTRIFYNPRMVPHFMVKVSDDPFMSMEGEVISMGDTKLVSKKFDSDKVYCSCVNSVVPPPPTKYFYLDLGGARYVKIVKPDVDDYKVSADVYRIVDGEKYGKIISNGASLFYL